jgi:hypothetical protein
MVCGRHDSRVAGVGSDKRPSPERIATDKVAPTTAIRTNTIDRLNSTLLGRSVAL